MSFHKGQTYCRPCHKPMYQRTNAIQKVAESLAGGRKTLRGLPKADRVGLRNLAAELHEAGATVASAEAARQTRADGFLYIIRNPAWRVLKIGRAFDAEARLSGYQTSSPYRDYELVHVSPYFEDCVSHERAVHAILAAVRMGTTEWFDVPVQIAKHIIDQQSPFRAMAAS